MRLLLTALIILCTFSCFAQNDLRSQIYKILNDTTGLKIFKREFKAYNQYQGMSDSVFNSSVTLEGTYSNEIVVDSFFTSLTAIVADSVKKKATEHILAEWKNKMQNILPGFEPKELKPRPWNPLLVKGWAFIDNTRLSFYISLLHKPKSSLYRVLFDVRYHKE